MIHKETYPVRWHETNAHREMRPGALLALMQETANLQFKKSGRSLDTIRDEEGVGFILTRLTADIKAPIHAYEEVTVETFTCPARGLTFPRGFVVKRGGKVVAQCHSTWALLRVDSHTPVRADDFALSFGDEAEVVTDTPLRFRAPREAVFRHVGSYTVSFADLDYNMHMNNTKYPDMVCNFLPDPATLQITGFSLSFLHEAAYGDTVEIERAEGEGGTYYFRTKKGETVCLEAMVTTKKREVTPS